MSNCIIDVNEFSSQPDLYWLQDAVERYTNEAIQSHMKNFLHCMKAPIPIYDDVTGEDLSHVLLLSNGEKARYTGLQRCRSPWACPHCTAEVMARRAARIVAAIEQFKEQGKLAFMVTLTIRHWWGVPGATIYGILRKAWHNVMIASRNGYDSLKSYLSGYGDFDFVNAYDWTWGRNGWHPHIHMLVWVDRDKIDSINARLAEFEEDIRKIWLRCVARATVSLMWHGKWRGYDGKVVDSWIREETFPDTPLGRYTKKVFEYVNCLNDCSSRTQSVHISRNDDGTIRISTSGDYICGAVKEVSSSHTKVAAPGHYNITQILYEAKKADGEGDTKRCRQFLYLWLEYFFITKNTRRLTFSVGANRAAREYIATHEFEEFLKKKYDEQDETYVAKKYKLVAVFSSHTWNLIQCHDLRGIILNTVVNTPTPYEDLCALLELYDIRMPGRPPDPDLWADEIDRFNDEEEEKERRFLSFCGLKSKQRRVETDWVKEYKRIRLIDACLDAGVILPHYSA